MTDDVSDMWETSWSFTAALFCCHNKDVTFDHFADSFSFFLLAEFKKAVRIMNGKRFGGSDEWTFRSLASRHRRIACETKCDVLALQDQNQ